MKRIAEALGVSRSNLLDRCDGRTRPRGSYRKSDDEGLLPLTRRFVDERPTYGYRRIAALVNRELAAKGQPAANRKRVHRIMQQASLLLEPSTGRREGRVHDGKVMVMRSKPALVLGGARVQLLEWRDRPHGLHHRRLRPRDHRLDRREWCGYQRLGRPRHDAAGSRAALRLHADAAPGRASLRQR